MTNDNYNDRSEYTKITWLEVREGDVLLHDNGDRLTVQSFEGLQIRTIAGLYAPSEYRGTGLTPYRPAGQQPELPTEPGAYADKDGKHWMRDTDGIWFELGRGWICAEEAAEYAPFTRLVPMPTREQIRETLFKTDPGTIYGVDAVVDGMKSLLGGGDDA